MNRVCFLSVYFGKVPDFFQPFLCSCTWNSDFDFLILCDSDIPYSIPANVRVVQMKRLEFVDKIKSTIGVDIPDMKPYKICDFRPAFGELFQDYICNYEFWGILDTDLILGNLSKFITNEILDCYDKIFTMGHMSLIRNKPELNSLYKKDTPHSRNYRQIFLNQSSCVFDEYRGFSEKFVDEGYRVYKEKVCGDVHCMAGRLEVADHFICKLVQPYNAFLSYGKDKNFRHEVFVLDRGSVLKIYFEKGVLKSKEYCYLHKLEHGLFETITDKSRLLITGSAYKKDNAFFIRLDEARVTPADMDTYNRQHFLKKLRLYLYLYFRLNIRYIRKKYFPRKDEI